MTALHVYKFTDETFPDSIFIAARDAEEAVGELHACYTCDAITPVQLSDADLDRLKVSVLDEDDAFTGEQITMRQYLDEQTGKDPEGEDAFVLCGGE